MTQPDRQKVFVGIPTHSGVLSAQTHQAVVRAMFSSGRRFHIMHHVQTVSLLAYNFNKLLTSAHNSEADWFVMLHSDIAPTATNWLDILIDTAEQEQLAALSVVSPIKSPQGYVSCALDRFPMVRKLTLHECLIELPQTFGPADTKRLYGSDKLLINTGCMLLRLKSLPPDKFHFHIEDRVLRDQSGAWGAWCNPEDYYFSQRLWKAKKPYAATTAVKLVHHGQLGYTNWEDWGQVKEGR